MKLTQVLLLLFLFVFNFGFSQTKPIEAPNYEIIKKAIEDKKSESYYPKLLKRMQENDTTLVLAEYRNLYFGYVFQKEYHPYSVNPLGDKLQKFYTSETLGDKEYDEFIKLATLSLKENPFDLKVMNFLGYVYHLKGNTDMAQRVSFTFQNIVHALFSSGDGFACDTAFHVISVNDEYVLLSMLEISSESQALIGNCDYLAFEKGKYKFDGLYFNISKLMEANYAKLKKG